MKKSIKGTQTEKNLLKSFAGESQARSRYEFAAQAAMEEGYGTIASIFTATAIHEQQHAIKFFTYLEGGEVEITAAYPAGKTGDTKANLIAAAQGEHEENTNLYPRFAQTAEEEGFGEIAATFRSIAAVEQLHETRFRKILERENACEGRCSGTVKTKDRNRVFQNNINHQWYCRNCGHIHFAASPLKSCPTCMNTNCFEIKDNNYV
ncbi:MAG: rubrerythrin family protein [Bacteroidales bacterium]|jgi:rubrerythrin|nr:rubrerythrin family protein [Bacteroidales bacterium]